MYSVSCSWRTIALSKAICLSLLPAIVFVSINRSISGSIKSLTTILRTPSISWATALCWPSKILILPSSILARLKWSCGFGLWNSLISRLIELLIPLGLIASSWYKYSTGTQIKAVFSLVKVSMKISVRLTFVSPASSKEYTSSSCSSLYLNSNWEPPFAINTCFNEGTSLITSASLMIWSSWNNFLATTKSASCFDLLQCSWASAKFEGSSFPPFANGRMWSILTLCTSKSIICSHIKHL